MSSDDPAPQSVIGRRFADILLFLGMASCGMALNGCSSEKGTDSGGGNWRVRDDLNSIRSALEMYRLKTGEIPSQGQGLKALIERSADLASGKRWEKLLDSVPVDPWNNNYIYLRNDRFPEGFGLYSEGADGEIQY